MVAVAAGAAVVLAAAAGAFPNEAPKMLLPPAGAAVPGIEVAVVVAPSAGLGVEPNSPPPAAGAVAAGAGVAPNTVFEMSA